MEKENAHYITKMTLEMSSITYWSMVCPLFQEDSCKLLKPFYYQRPNILKFKSLMTSTNKTVLSNLAKFVSIIVNKF